MRASGEWKMLGEPTTKVFVKEREHLSVHFKGDIKLTINQMDSEIVFHSRRWQGHQVKTRYLLLIIPIQNTVSPRYGGP